MVIKTELVVSSIKNAIFESRKSGGTPIERFIKRYTFIDTRFQTSVGETRFISSQASYFFFLFFFFMKRLVKRRSTRTSIIIEEERGFGRGVSLSKHAKKDQIQRHE